VALGTLEKFAVDADVVAAGVGFGAQYGDHLAVDLDSALLDHDLGTAAAGYAGSGENFLEALKFGGWTRRGSEIGIGGGVGFQAFFRG
jgi:hypothetical protein